MMNAAGDSRRQTTKLDELGPATKSFFEKLSGYDTLRLILCDRAILVEGPCDELIVQRAYMKEHGRKLPIEDGIDVISVGTSFLRFLEIAEKIDKHVHVVTDNDGDYDNKVAKKYARFIGNTHIEICADTNNELETLEPQIVDANGGDLSALRKMLGLEESAYPDNASIVEYMSNNKTEWALKVFEAPECIQFPQYILNAVSDHEPQ